MCGGTGENTAGNGGGRSGSVSIEMQNMDRRFSDYQMNHMNPYVKNMNFTGFGQYGAQNIMGNDGIVRATPPGKEATTGGMTPM